MNSELLPCPFCKDGGKPERRSFEHFVGNPSNGIVEMEDWVSCIICGASADTHVWNQRAERTCKCEVKVDEPSGMTLFWCSECGNPSEVSYSYCPSCGAKVAE